MQILVRLEAISLKDAVGAFDMHKRVAAHLMESLVPIYLLGLDEFFFVLRITTLPSDATNCHS